MTEQHLEAVVGRVQDLIMTHVTPTVTLAAYGTAPVQPPSPPALILYVPLLNWVRSEVDNAPDEVMDRETGALTVWPPPRYYDLIFRYELLGDPLAVVQLAERLARFFGTHSAVAVDRAARAGGTETVAYRLEERGETDAVRAPEGGQYHPLSGMFAVRMVAVRAAQESGTTTRAADSLTVTYERKEESP